MPPPLSYSLPAINLSLTKVVYEISCQNWDKVYIDQTSQLVKFKMAQHKRTYYVSTSPKNVV